MPSSGGVKLEGGPVLSEGEASMLESDTSSIISTSDHLVLSDTEEEDGLQDLQKYRFPDPRKTRLNLRTKEPLSPTARQVSGSPKRQTGTPTPTMPYAHSAAGGPSRNCASPDISRNSNVENASDSDFVGSGLSRAGSIYTLSRISFSGQLAQLTNMRLPDANSLGKRIAAIPTSTEAVKALTDASDQIRMWIGKVGEVLGGLNAEDDVEWAAAGGREGVEDVDSAILRFDKLVQVYVLSIEEMQMRDDVSDLTADELMSSVKQMESIITNWSKVKWTLSGVKEQVEIAMEWEEVWNNVLGEIGQELNGLSQLVFEMEEKRHEGTGTLLSSKDSIDLNELETIVEQRPGRGQVANSSDFTPLPFPFSSNVQATPTPHDKKEDASLLALFARMQPVRASLDFLPMRLSSFHTHGSTIFPTACSDLEQRRDQLEAMWKKLEDDAESLRRELGEDRWIMVFRNAGRQAMNMYESVARSYNKLKEATDDDEQQNDMHNLSKKIESYQAKRVHYGPAIDRVLAIIDRGVLERLTVNGEILRLQSDMTQRWNTLQADMRDMDLILEDINNDSRDKQLRDSVSTVMSSERSIAESLVETPGSSPASSVVHSSRRSSFQGSRTPTPLMNYKSRHPSANTTASTPTRNFVSRLPSASAKSSEVRLSRSPSGSSSLLAASRATSRTSSMSTTRPSKSDRPADNKPRWVASMKTEDRASRPLAALEPSPYAKAPVTPKTNFLRSSAKPTPLSAPAERHSTRIASMPTPPSTIPRILSSGHAPQKSSLPVPKVVTPEGPSTSLTPKNASTPYRSSPTTLNRRRSSLLSVSIPIDEGHDADTEGPAHHRRPPSALAAGRRSSLAPLQPKGRLEVLGAATGTQGQKPRWRG